VIQLGALGRARWRHGRMEAAGAELLGITLMHGYTGPKKI
jgi:hypothetical protein